MFINFPLSISSPSSLLFLLFYFFFSPYMLSVGDIHSSDFKLYMWVDNSKILVTSQTSLLSFRLVYPAPNLIVYTWDTKLTCLKLTLWLLFPYLSPYKLVCPYPLPSIRLLVSEILLLASPSLFLTLNPIHHQGLHDSSTKIFLSYYHFCPLPLH